ncbi:hypothetical protein [Streptomyces collinus]|nr:hypothetical protein [Streptomyces collinus]
MQVRAGVEAGTGSLDALWGHCANETVITFRTAVVTAEERRR